MKVSAVCTITKSLPIRFSTFVNCSLLANFGYINLFIQKKVGAISNSLTIKESHKSVNNNIDVFRIANQTTILRTSLYFVNTDNSKKLADGVLSLYNENYLYDIDANDAEQIENWDEDISILHKNKMLSIDYRPPVNQLDTIQLQIARLRTMNYQWEFKAENFTSNGLTAYLQDNYPTFHETEISLTGVTIIPFSTTNDAASKAANRFKIVYKSSNVLPVNITQVTAYQQNENIKIDWQTQSEINITNYNVEKSINGITFTSIGIVAGKSGLSNNYSFTDTKMVNSNNFYRIKAISSNNEIKYSSIILVKASTKTSEINIYPNPVIGNTVNLALSNVPKGSYTLCLFNQHGQKIISQTINHNTPNTSETLNLSNLPNGNYEIIIRDKSMMLSKKITKAN